MEKIALNDKVLKASIVATSFLPSLTLADSHPSCPGGIAGGDPIAGAQCAAPSKASGDLFASGGLFQKISDTLIFIIAAISVIMLIIGGLRYVISQGDKTHVESAKNTILYAIIGLVVAILAYGIVHFVLQSILGTGDAGA